MAKTEKGHRNGVNDSVRLLSRITLLLFPLIYFLVLQFVTTSMPDSYPPHELGRVPPVTTQTIGGLFPWRT